MALCRSEAAKNQHRIIKQETETSHVTNGNCAQPYHVRANYMVAQTDVEGHSHIFSAGEYRYKIAMEIGTPKFKDKIVVPDTFNIDRPLAVTF